MLQNLFLLHLNNDFFTRFQQGFQHELQLELKQSFKRLEFKLRAHPAFGSDLAGGEASTPVTTTAAQLTNACASLM